MSSATMQKTCAVCRTPALQQCGGCKSVYYCTREHQKQHWKTGHKGSCSVVRFNGPWVAAARDIKRGEVIARESALVVAPAKASGVVCLGCNKNPRDETGNVYRCTNCNYPMCNKKCQESVAHQDECRLMTAQHYKTDLECDSIKTEAYDFIGTLRLLLQSKVNNAIVQLLQSAPEIKPNVNLTKSVVDFLKKVLKLNCPEKQIEQACLYFEQKSTAAINFRAIYPTIARLKHDCNPNTKHTSDNLQTTLIATVPILKGEAITIAHSETLWGTSARLQQLRSTRAIECDCKRCRDPTELATYLDAIYCSKCKTALEAACPKMLSSNPLDVAAVWKCETCTHTIKGKQMAWGNEAIKTEMNRLGKNPLHLEQFLTKYKETLHPTNYHALIAKYTLNQIYGNVHGYTFSDLTDGIVERKIEICHELLEVLDELAPGSTIIRGSVLYELQSALVVQAKRDFTEEKITKSAAQETLQQSIVLLKEATEILNSEPNMDEFLQDKLQQLAKELDF